MSAITNKISLTPSICKKPEPKGTKQLSFRQEHAPNVSMSAGQQSEFRTRRAVQLYTSINAISLQIDAASTANYAIKQNLATELTKKYAKHRLTQELSDEIINDYYESGIALAHQHIELGDFVQALYCFEKALTAPNLHLSDYVLDAIEQYCEIALVCKAPDSITQLFTTLKETASPSSSDRLAKLQAKTQERLDRIQKFAPQDALDKNCYGFSPREDAQLTTLFYFYKEGEKPTLSAIERAELKDFYCYVANNREFNERIKKLADAPPPELNQDAWIDVFQSLAQLSYKLIPERGTKYKLSVEHASLVTLKSSLTAEIQKLQKGTSTKELRAKKLELKEVDQALSYTTEALQLKCEKGKLPVKLYLETESLSHLSASISDDLYTLLELDANPVFDSMINISSQALSVVSWFSDEIEKSHSFQTGDWRFTNTKKQAILKKHTVPLLIKFYRTISPFGHMALYDLQSGKLSLAHHVEKFTHSEPVVADYFYSDTYRVDIAKLVNQKCQQVINEVCHNNNTTLAKLFEAAIVEELSEDSQAKAHFEGLYNTTRVQHSAFYKSLLFSGPGRLLHSYPQKIKTQEVPLTGEMCCSQFAVLITLKALERLEGTLQQKLAKEQDTPSFPCLNVPKITSLELAAMTTEQAFKTYRSLLKPVSNPSVLKDLIDTSEVSKDLFAPESLDSTIVYVGKNILGYYLDFANFS